MRQDQITIGMQASARVGSRIATVTVLGERTTRSFGGRRQTVYRCRTHDTGREIEASAARLRPAPGATAPASRSAEADARRRAARAERAARAAEEATLETYHRAAQEFVPAWTAEGLRDHAEAWLARLPGEGARAAARAAILRALDHSPALPTYSAWSEIVTAGLQGGYGGPRTRPAAVPGRGLVTHINRDRLVELPCGENLAALRDRLGRVHVGESLLTVCRGVARRLGRHGTRRLPVAMRRGLWQAAAQIHAHNRAVYREVMGGDPLPPPRAVADAVGVACGLGPCPR